MSNLQARPYVTTVMSTTRPTYKSLPALFGRIPWFSEKDPEVMSVLLKRQDLEIVYSYIAER